MLVLTLGAKLLPSPQLRYMRESPTSKQNLPNLNDTDAVYVDEDSQIRGNYSRTISFEQRSPNVRMLTAVLRP